MKRSRAPSQLAKSRASKAAKQTKAPVRYRNFSIPRTVGRTGSGFPKQMRMKHRYVDAFTLSSVAGALTKYFFRCNGMYDPNLTGTGHQPFYFDQMSALYNHFTVLKSTIVIQASFDTLTATQTNGILACLIEDDASNSDSQMSTVMEQNSAVWRLILAGSQNAVTFAKKWDAVEAFGPNPSANDNLQGSASADPTEQQTFMIAFQPGTAANAATTVWVTIQYEALWDELKDPGQS